MRLLFSKPLLNATLRFASLAVKLLFSLYMGRYLGLAQMGAYGLIAAYVALLVTLLGLRFDYVALRDLVDATPLDAARKIRDEAVFFGLNYLMLAVAIALSLPGPLHGIAPEMLLFTFLLSVLESFAAIMAGNVVSLKMPVLANILLFARMALWTFPVMALGIFLPSLRTAECILYGWAGGVAFSIIATFFALRHLPWRQALTVPVDWRWIKDGVRKCGPIWIGALGMTAATYADRFAVEHYLGLKYVGIASFYGSFALAIQSLLQSGVSAFAYPKLIAHYRKGDHASFRSEIMRMTVQTTLFSALLSVSVGAIVPMLGETFHRPEFTRYAPVLWLMLFGIWLRGSCESLYYVLYARGQDRHVWIGGLLVLIPAFGGNLLLVPAFGFMGIGYSAVLVAVTLCAWRIYAVYAFGDRQP